MHPRNKNEKSIKFQDIHFSFTSVKTFTFHKRDLGPNTRLLSEKAFCIPGYERVEKRIPEKDRKEDR